MSQGRTHITHLDSKETLAKADHRVEQKAFGEISKGDPKNAESLLEKNLVKKEKAMAKEPVKKPDIVKDMDKANQKAGTDFKNDDVAHPDKSVEKPKEGKVEGKE